MEVVVRDGDASGRMVRNYLPRFSSRRRTSMQLQPVHAKHPKKIHDRVHAEFDSKESTGVYAQFIQVTARKENTVRDWAVLRIFMRATGPSNKFVQAFRRLVRKYTGEVHLKLSDVASVVRRTDRGKVVDIRTSIETLLGLRVEPTLEYNGDYVNNCL